MAPRISRNPEELARQCGLAAFAITSAGPGWPASAPSSATLTTCNTNLTSQLSVINSLETQLRAARQAMKPMIDAARDAMAKVDQATDLLYGPDGAEKQNFGLTPKKVGGEASGEPEQVVITATTDGTQPASIWIDWDTVEGAVYELQWFSDAALTQMVGSATVTNSEYEIPGLTKGNQYWFRVRAVRASLVGPWSDQATRVANI
ncbi:MAG: fibronectin type III domain-containing protein [Candidatus Sumerlaeota bacterium]|nr:fibronectin type III domain-containing protein [Candidatus Sumerlaeota bacterium]